MTNKHPLLERAQRYPYKNIDLSPANCRYDVEVGAWRLKSTGQLWVEVPGRVGPRTKKNDIETGEDQKGE